MPMRNPMYLDLELVLNVADYEGIAYAVETDVTLRGSSTTTGGGELGLPGTGFQMSKEGVEETQQSYTMAAKPFRVMNDVLDRLEDDGKLLDADGDEIEIKKNSLVLIEGTLSLTSTSEAGTLLSRIFPAMAASGGTVMTDEIKGQIISGMIQPNKQPERQLYRFTDAIGGRTVLVPISRESFFRTNSYDDLDAEVTLIGVVDRAVGVQQNYSLEKWLLPDMDRAVRRSFKGKALDQMLTGLGESMGIDASTARSITGPALEVRPLVIY